MEPSQPSRELSPADSLALIEQQRHQVGRELDINPTVLYGASPVAVDSSPPRPGSRCGAVGWAPRD